MKLNPDKVPATFDEAVRVLHDSLSATDREVIMECSPADVHHTVGRYVRNNWSLWEDTPLKRDFISRFKLFGHADDISGLLMTSLWAVVCRTPNLAEVQAQEVERYRAHWRNYGVNPETGHQLSS